MQGSRRSMPATVLCLWHPDGRKELCRRIASADSTAGFACPDVITRSDWNNSGGWVINERENLVNNQKPSFRLFLLVFAVCSFSSSVHVSLLSLCINIHILTIFSLNMCAYAPSIGFPPHYISYNWPIFFPSLFSCLPSLREFSNNRSLDNLDCIGGTGSSLPRWDDDDFSQACSTLGRRSCIGQVRTHCWNVLKLYLNYVFQSKGGN